MDVDCGRHDRLSRERPIYLYSGRFFSPKRSGNNDSSDEPQEWEGLYEVRIIDNDYNTYQEVMEVSMLALDLTEDRAFAVAWEVDHRGSCVVAHVPHAEAEAIADIIRTIGIEVEVNLLNPGSFSNS
jgi:ATP-dependent Clp protease adapter protein ClpS